MNASQYRVFVSMLNTRNNPDGVLFAQGGYWFSTCDDECIAFLREIIDSDMGVITDYNLDMHSGIMEVRIVIS
jgi:hypothetical protein